MEKSNPEIGKYPFLFARYGAKFGIFYPAKPTMGEKVKELQEMDIFLHDYNHFYLYKEDNMPSSTKIDTSLLQYRKENSIQINFRRVTRRARA